MNDDENLLHEDLIILDYDANSKDALLKGLSKILIEKGYVKESYTEGILSRESIYPTGLNTAGVKVAIPHTDSIHVNKPAILVAKLKKPITFKEMGNGVEDIEASLVFMLAVINPNHQLATLSKLMSVFSNEKMLKDIYYSKNKKEVINKLSSLLK